MTDAAPLVSVVIPTRNRPRSANAAVDSVLSQTYHAIELWVIDDASDPPFELSEARRRDPRPNLIRLDDRQGGGGARNEGIARCRGSFIAFLDDDDEWRPDKLERQVPPLRSAPASVGAVECGYEMRRAGRLDFRYSPLPKPDLARSLLERPTLQPSTMLMRRSALDVIGGFDASLERVHDWELWLRLADRFSVVSMPDVLVVRNHHELPAAENAAWTQSFYDFLRPRIEKLPAAERRRVLAWHRFDIGMQLARSGSAHEGFLRILEAWRLRPTSVRYLASVVAARLGPRALRAGSSAAGAAHHLARRLRGSDPYLRRW